MENTTTVSGTEVKKYRRAGFMDEVRGFCILCMVVYHVCFDLNYTYNIHIPKWAYGREIREGCS